MKVSREDLAWASGLFEGKGCISGWTVDGHKRYFHTTLSTTDEDVIRKFHLIVGVGTVTGPFQKAHYKPYWRFRTSSFEEGQALIAVLWSWLGTRRKAKAVEVLKAVSFLWASIWSSC